MLTPPPSQTTITPTTSLLCHSLLSLVSDIYPLPQPSWRLGYYHPPDFVVTTTSVRNPLYRPASTLSRGEKNYPYLVATINTTVRHHSIETLTPKLSSPSPPGITHHKQEEGPRETLPLSRFHHQTAFTWRLNPKLYPPSPPNITHHKLEKALHHELVLTPLSSYTTITPAPHYRQFLAISPPIVFYRRFYVIFALALLLYRRTTTQMVPFFRFKILKILGLDSKLVLKTCELFL